VVTKGGHRFKAKPPFSHSGRIGPACQSARTVVEHIGIVSGGISQVYAGHRSVGRRGESGCSRHLARRVHELYFNPEHEEYQPRTMWSLSNAFTSALKELDPIPQFRATANLGAFLDAVATGPM
jgi:hypothetical protein